MTKIFKCDFCGSVVDHEHQIRKGSRTGFESHPSFGELYPELADADICNDCGQAAIEAEREVRPQLLQLIRERLQHRRA